jgi:hypothetical protein
MKEGTMKEYHESTLTGLAPGEDSALHQAVDQSRRRFVSLNLLGLAFVPAAGLLVSENTWAGRTGRYVHEEGPALVQPDDPEAKALRYSAQSPKTAQSCSNCQLYTGVEGEDFGPCAIFSYRVAPSGKQLMVKAQGWCRAWAPRQKL